LSLFGGPGGKISLPNSLAEALQREAKDAGRTLDQHVADKLQRITPPPETIDKAKILAGFPKLVDFFAGVPAVSVVSSQVEDDAYWWIKFDIDLEHHLAWRVVQEFGFVLNYISVSEPLPTVFKPVSPPPYLNGGTEFLSWVVESTFNYIDPEWILSFLEGRLPQPVSDETAWMIEED